VGSRYFAKSESLFQSFLNLSHKFVASVRFLATTYATGAICKMQVSLSGTRESSTQGQDLEQQRLALGQSGCQRIFEEKISGAKRDRPELGRLLDHLRPGDVLTVTRLDRLARSTTDLLHIAERLKEIDAGLRSLAEPWADTTSPAGRMILTIFAGIADFERALISERTSAGRAAAKAKGVRFGPKPALTSDQVTHAKRMIEEGQSVSEVAWLLGVHRATLLYRALSQ
jgi:DNA invertase Pin-like site-specific DNA recombinase